MTNAHPKGRKSKHDWYFVLMIMTPIASFIGYYYRAIAGFDRKD